MSLQKTLKDSFQFYGKGLHTGLDINIKFLPAEVNTGIRIKRVDMPESPEIQALADFVIETTRGTVLKRGDVQVSTIEHAMSALFACEVDNCLIEIDAPEFPILDGSAIQYYDAIQRVGLVTQDEEQDVYVVRKKIEYSLPDSKSKIILLPDDSFSVDVHVDYNSPVLASQSAFLDNIENYGKDIADSRTFVFVREIKFLLQQNLIKGGDLDNAIVIYDEKVSQEELDQLADLMKQSHRSAEKLGFLSGELKHSNEPARHKLLDVVGDLALIGKRIQGKVVAYYPGHSTNTGAAKFIRKEIKKQEVYPPIYDDSIPPILDVVAIRKMLPHRWPFLMVDKIIEIGKKHIVGVKNITVNETLFMGHFPQEPIFPGVLLVEAMAQIGGLLVLHDLEDADKYSTYFMKIDNVKFRQKVVPGDTVICHLSLIDEIRRGIATMRGYAFVGGNVVAEAEFMAQIIKNK